MRIVNPGLLNGTACGKLVAGWASSYGPEGDGVEDFNILLTRHTTYLTDIRADNDESFNLHPLRCQVIVLLW